ncbi:MAG: DNA-binding protein [Candidatus Methanoplasma sp.]|jgi:predicted DNA-binding protein with PD1-like motif|nr:DNA-binding protein [Candidatus Methanoplasma sp.]
MRFAEMAVGRIFVLKLETGESLHETVEEFARDNGIRNATLAAVGGVDKGSVMTVGPEYPNDGRIVPMLHVLDAPCELTATGTLFSDEDGNPIMHMHGSAGREGKSVTGCLRSGMVAWLVLEVTVTEFIGDGATRKKDPRSGMKILQIG